MAYLLYLHWDPHSVSSWEPRGYILFPLTVKLRCWHFNKASFLPACRTGVYPPSSRQQQEFLNYPINVEKNIEFGNLKLVVTWLDRLKSSNNVSILQQNIFKMFTLISFIVFLTEGKTVARLDSLQYFYPKLCSKVLACCHVTPIIITCHYDHMTSWHVPQY